MKQIIPHHLKAHQSTYLNQMNKVYSSFFIPIVYENYIVPFVVMVFLDSYPILIVSIFLTPCLSVLLNSSFFMSVL